VIDGYVFGALWLYAIILGYFRVVQRYRKKRNVMMEKDSLKGGVLSTGIIMVSIDKHAKKSLKISANR
jgi:hypothetical protein